MTFKLIDKCASATNPNHNIQVLLTASNYINRFRMRLTPNQVKNFFYPGRCLYLRAEVKGGGMEFSFMQGFYSKDRHYFESDAYHD